MWNSGDGHGKAVNTDFFFYISQSAESVMRPRVCVFSHVCVCVLQHIAFVKMSHYILGQEASGSATGQLPTRNHAAFYWPAHLWCDMLFCTHSRPLFIDLYRINVNTERNLIHTRLFVDSNATLWWHLFKKNTMTPTKLQICFAATTETEKI